MNLSETADLLTAMSAFDRRTIGDGDVIAWQAVLSDASFDDCLEAVKRHYAEQTEWMMPAHVRRLVRDIVNEREMAARATGWAPGQAGVPKDQAHPEVTEAVKALEQLPASVLDFVTRVRAMLPEGSKEALMPRRVAWEREHRAYARVRDAGPNPRYRPQGMRCRWCRAEVGHNVGCTAYGESNPPYRPQGVPTPCNTSVPHEMHYTDDHGSMCPGA